MDTLAVPLAIARHPYPAVRGYGYAAPHLLLWGGVCIVGFLSGYVFPAQANRIWVPLNMLGFTGSVLIARYYRVQGVRAQTRNMWRVLVLMLTCVAFVFVSYLVFQPRESAWLRHT